MCTCKTATKITRINICVVLEGMYTYKTSNFGSKPFCLCLCCSIGYVIELDLYICWNCYWF